MNRSTFALPVVALLAVAGCSAPAAQDAPTTGPTTAAAASPPTTPTPTATALPAGTFKLTTVSGADITFTLPTPATDPELAELEAYRVKAGGAPVSYLVADVDNRKGTAAVDMYMVSAFNEEGRQYTFTNVTDAIGLWTPSYGTDLKWKNAAGKVLADATGDALQREGVDLNNRHLNGADVAERATLILASTDGDLPAKFTLVTVQPSGTGEDEEAKPAS